MEKKALTHRQSVFFHKSFFFKEWDEFVMSKLISAIDVLTSFVASKSNFIGTTVFLSRLAY